MKEINTEEFNKLVYNIYKAENNEINFLGEKPVVIDFYATWCGPCKVLAPKLEDLEEDYTNVDFYKIDIEKNEELTRILNIRNVPTALYINKTINMRTVGVLSRDQIIARITELL
ncbi:MAG: thioredoxin family protein [Candidatus Pacearchaeota archaeon]|jgi:thioredoxin|nr:thioredoxin family protein [Clostridia bacterium]